MKRKVATELIEELRIQVAKASANPELCRRAIAVLAGFLEGCDVAPLQACHGEAHSNPHIDNCGLCSPRWGWLGAKEPIT